MQEFNYKLAHCAVHYWRDQPEGGVAKTTTAVHLQAWLTRYGYPAVLVDADGQESSSAWAQDLNLPFQALHNPEDLFEKLPILAKDAIVIVDGPANAGEVTKAILNRAELAIIPSKQSMIDLRSFGDVVRIVGHIQELRNGLPKAALFLSDINPQTVLFREAREALSAFQITLLETAIPHRACIEDCSGQKQTVFDMKGTAATAAQANYKSTISRSAGVIHQWLKGEVWLPQYSPTKSYVS